MVFADEGRAATSARRKIHPSPLLRQPPLECCHHTQGPSRPSRHAHFRRHKGKSIARDKVEDQFEEMLRSVIPDRTTFELADRMFREAWEKRSGTAEEEAKRLRTKSRQIERELSAFVERSVQTKNAAVIEAIENKIAELQSEKLKIDEAAAKTACPARTFDEMFELL